MKKRSGIFRLAAKIAVFLLPVIIYYLIFAVFEPYNYFGFKQSGYNTNQPIYRVRSFTQNPQNAVLLGDSRMAHLSDELIEEITGRKFSNLAFGGASQKEIIDLFWYAVKTNPDIDTVYLEVSFYTLNESYQKDRVGNIETIVNNPLAYMLNFDYNLEMLNNLKNVVTGTPVDFNAEETAEYTSADYIGENSQPLLYRRQLLEYCRTIYPRLSSLDISGTTTENLADALLSPSASQSSQWKLNTGEYSRLLEVAEYCRANNIRLVFVLPPVDDSIYNLIIQPLGIDAPMRQAVDGLRASGAEVRDFEITERPDFSDDMFFDGFHLDTRRGLPVYTHILFGDE